MNSGKAKYHQYPALILILALVLGAAPAAGARSLDPRAEATLFSLKDLGPVDLSTKAVTVEVYVGPEPELADCRRMLAQVLEQVGQFYAQMGVRLEWTTGRAQPGALAPAKRLRLEMLPDKQWLGRSFKAFKVAPPFQLRFLQVCLDKCAFAHLNLSTIHVSFKRFKRAEFSTDPKDAGLNRYWLANLLIHELGHLMGLYHSFEFTNDPVAAAVAGHRRTPNFMSHDIAFQPHLGFVDFQKRLIHSYLGGGKVFQQYQSVEFDPLKYLEVVKRVNGFQEPPPARATRMAHGVKKPKAARSEDD